jgi:uncharacterized membrane protein
VLSRCLRRPVTAPVAATQGRAEGGTHGRVGVFPESIAGALAYFTFIPAILFLVLNPYNKNPFVRFHSVHCLLFWGAGILITLTLKLASLVLFIIPVLGPLLVVLVSVVAGLAAVMIWLVLVIKALQGEMFKIPVLGEFAEHYAEPL